MKTIATLVFAAWGSAALACSSDPLNFDWNIQPGDQRITGDFLEQTVRGKKVRFGAEYEHYRRNGRYTFFDGQNQYRADSYVIYADGSRCINYSPARYDLYVMRDGKLLLINERGERYPAQVTR
ncbi:MAG: hypothetical protein AAFQ15_05295 [Pseudomonadota bacterium]